MLIEDVQEDEDEEDKATKTFQFDNPNDHKDESSSQPSGSTELGVHIPPVFINFLTQAQKLMHTRRIVLLELCCRMSYSFPEDAPYSRSLSLAQFLVQKWMYRREGIPSSEQLQQYNPLKDHDRFKMCHQYQEAMRELLRILVYEPFDMEMMLVQHKASFVQTTLYPFGRHIHGAFGVSLEELYECYPSFKRQLSSLQNPTLRMFRTNSMYETSSFHSEFVENAFLDEHLDRKRLFMLAAANILSLALLAGKSPFQELEALENMLYDIRDRPGTKPRPQGNALVDECIKAVKDMRLHATPEQLNDNIAHILSSSEFPPSSSTLYRDVGRYLKITASEKGGGRSGSSKKLPPTRSPLLIQGAIKKHTRTAVNKVSLLS